MVTRLEPIGGWSPMIAGTAAAAAVTTFALRIWKGTTAPWGKTGIVCQIVFSAAVGYFYANLFKRSVTPTLTKDEKQLIEFTEKLRSTPLEKLGTLLAETPLDRLAGQTMLKILSSYLLSNDGHYPISFDKPAAAAENAAQFSKDLLQHLSLFLSLYELLQLSMTCKKMFQSICGAEGQNLWRNKTACSLTSVRDMKRLVKSLQSLTASNAYTPYMLHGRLLKQALFLAWPPSLLQIFGKHLSYSHNIQDGLPLLWLNAAPCQTLNQLFKHIQEDIDALLIARFLQEHPECFDLCEELNNGQRYYLFATIALFGLPRNSLDAFCKWLNGYLIKRNLDQTFFQLENGTYIFEKILQRISCDNPDYSFQGRLPPRNLLCFTPGVCGEPWIIHLELDE